MSGPSLSRGDGGGSGGGIFVGSFFSSHFVPSVEAPHVSKHLAPFEISNISCSVVRALNIYFVCPLIAGVLLAALTHAARTFFYSPLG